MTDFTGLATAGRIATPDDSDWDQARLAWNLAADQRPVAVVFAESANDVAATIRFAVENDFKVAAQGTGHGAAPLVPLEGTILLKTERMRGIEIDPDARTARVEAGVLVLELSEAAGAHGLSSMPGSAPDVGVVGYTLGGGLSWLGRRHGFACNRVRTIELIDADGEGGGSTPRTTPTSSGRCAAVGAATRSSPPSTSIYCRSPSSTRALSSSPPRSAQTRSAPTATGPQPCPTRSPRWSASSRRRRSRTCQSRSAADRC
jgi:FAD/FMN-containing dehydrogenase